MFLRSGKRREERVPVEREIDGVVLRGYSVKSRVVPAWQGHLLLLRRRLQLQVTRLLRLLHLV
jgi:hypothetical protein